MSQNLSVDGAHVVISVPIGDDNVEGGVERDNRIEASRDRDSVTEGGDGNRANREEDSQSSLNALQPLAYFLPFAVKDGPFLLLLLLKVLYTHRFGLLIIIAAGFGWTHLDSILTELIGLRSHSRFKQLFTKVSWILAISTINVFSVYFWLDDQKILSSRLYLSTDSWQAEKYTDIWTFLWVLIVTDYVVKYCTLMIKCVILIMPKHIISYQRKGSLYSFVERTTFLYRSLLPIIPWYYFLLGSGDGNWFSCLLFIAYVVIKFYTLYKQVPPTYQTFLRIFKETTYGEKPSTADIANSEKSCPVCHDEYSNPISLTCKHIFCEDCLSVWFDREKTCPMCRAQIITEDCSYRNGSGIQSIQFY